MALDNDESGKLANVEAINLLLSHKIPVKACTFSGYKDANQLLLEGSREDMIITPGEEFVWKYQLSKMPKEFIKKFLYHIT